MRAEDREPETDALCRLGPEDSDEMTRPSTPPIAWPVGPPVRVLRDSLWEARMSSLVSDHHGILAPCTSCGQMNRRRYATIDRATRCGSCHAMLSPVASPIDALDVESFDAIVRHASVPVIVDFWAPWCRPCHIMAPELEEAARRLPGQALFVKVDTDAVPDLASHFGVRSIPTLAVFQNGRERSRVTGARSAADIQSLVAPV